jgi:hypothetical protein
MGLLSSLVWHRKSYLPIILLYIGAKVFARIEGIRWNARQKRRNQTVGDMSGTDRDISKGCPIGTNIPMDEA